MRKTTWFILMVCLVSFSGCSSKPVFNKYDTGEIKRIEIITSLKSNDIEIIDFGNMRGRVYQDNAKYLAFMGGYFGGILGGSAVALLAVGADSLNSKIRAQHQLKSNVEGDKVSLESELAGKLVEAFFNKTILDEMEGYIDSKPNPSLVLFNGRVIKNTLGLNIVDDSINDIENKININFSYGVGARTDEELCAVIAGDIYLVNDNEKLFNDKLKTFSCSYSEKTTLEDFAKDNAELYKQLFEQAAGKFARGIVFRFFY